MRVLLAALLPRLWWASLLFGGMPLAGQTKPTPIASEASAWTNLVGNVLIAEPVAHLADRGTIRFRLAHGEMREISLAAFPESERTRLSIALGSPPIPPSLIETWDFAHEASRRAQALVASGRATSEDCERRRTALRTMLRKAILALPDLSPSHRQALLQKANTL